MFRKLSMMTSLLLVASAALCVAAPSTADQSRRGELYVMPGGFVVDLDSGETAMLSVALELGAGRAWLTAPEQERVRGVVTRAVENAPGTRLVSSAGRQALAARLHRDIRSTGLPVESVLIPDLAVS